MNILIIGKLYENVISEIKKSKLLDKLYTAGNEYSEKIPHIEFSTVDELVEKAKILEIDIAINFDKTLIYNDICEKFRRNKLNLISMNKKWMNLELNELATKELLMHYSVNTAKIIKTPLVFPVTVRTSDSSKEVFSIKELTEYLETEQKQNPYFEETINGEQLDLLSVWDGQNIYHFNSNDMLNEVKLDRLDLFKTKLNFMLSDEKADFTGFFTTHLVWAKNDWYVKTFSAGINDNFVFPVQKMDFLYIINSAIYQKLNEIM